MIKKKPERLTIMSYWTNGQKICRMTMTKEMVRWADGYIKPERMGDFTFTIYNPFPCTKMRSTYRIVSEWMGKNGWHKTFKFPHTRCVSGVYIDDAGEVVRGYTERTIYISANQ